MTSGFLFVDAPGNFRHDNALIVRLPRHLSSKQKLFAALADKLHFPSYFGWNWDALEECLGDLSWLPNGRAVFLVHQDLPFRSGGTNRQIYVDLLRQLATQSSKSGRLSFVFPADCRSDLTGD